MSSVDQRKGSRKKKLNDNELVSSFIDKKPTEETEGEPSSKKNKLADAKDDSLKFFKSIATSKTKSSSSEAGSSKSNAASEFINKPSTSKEAAKKKPPTKKNAKKKTEKLTDIRKALSKPDRLYYHAINESCADDGVDAFEMQLAIAISESLKDTNETAGNELKTLDNPFASTGKIQSVNSVLERYGFKSKKVYSSYEIEMIMNNKGSKRTKYKKVPTLLTNTSENARDELIRTRIDQALNSELFADLTDGDGQNPHPVITSPYLLECYEMYRTNFKKSSTENMIDSDFYVADLFEPSNVKAGHLLKNWDDIIGRDRSPKKTIPKENFEEPPEVFMPQDEPPRDQSPNSSCSDIFEGIESFSSNQFDDNPVNEDENELKSVSEHLDLLHEKISQTVLQSQKIDIAENQESAVEIDLTQDDSMESDNTQEYIYPIEEVDEKVPENSGTSQKKNCDVFDLTQNESSDDAPENNEEEIFDLTQCADQQPVSSKSSFNENEVIDISDEEVNYSINRYQRNEESMSPESNVQCTQSEESCDVIEVDNLVEQSLIDIVAKEEDVKIDHSVTELLTNFSVNRRSSSRKNRSMIFLENENINDDSIANIMKKYGVLTSPPPAASKNKSFSKIHSESDLERFSQPNDDVDLEVINDNSCADVPQEASFATNMMEKYGVGVSPPLVKRRSFTKIQSESDLGRFSKNNDEDLEIASQCESQEASIEDMNVSINKSLAHILNSPMVRQAKAPQKAIQRRSLGIALNDKYVIDTESLFIEPDFASMTPIELKQELFKYGIRPLPVKKAIELLSHIYNQTHPKIRIAMDEEIDMNDSRRDMNITDIVSNIGMHGEEDEFVFQLDSAGILEDEEYILPKMKKSKVPTCLLPLHISFYNMIRSNEKLQRYILEFRPLDLDQIYKHFRKFDLTYQLNDIIAFLDKRCITFKTKEQSYSKKHERKKQNKRSQKSS